MKDILSFAAIALAVALVTSCATEQDYNTTTTTSSSNQTGAVRTAGSPATMPNQGPSMMSGGPR